jgi:hypothetical protein
MGVIVGFCLRQHQINWPEILPLTAIAKSRHEKIRSFLELQLMRGGKSA